MGEEGGGGGGGGGVLLQGVTVQPVEHVCLSGVAQLVPCEGLIVVNILQPKTNLGVGAELVPGATKRRVQGLHSGAGRGDTWQLVKSWLCGVNSCVIVGRSVPHARARREISARARDHTSICAPIDSAVSRPAEK